MTSDEKPGAQSISNPSFLLAPQTFDLIADDGTPETVHSLGYIAHQGIQGQPDTILIDEAQNKMFMLYQNGDQIVIGDLNKENLAVIHEGLKLFGGAKIEMGLVESNDNDDIAPAPDKQMLIDVLVM